MLIGLVAVPQLAHQLPLKHSILQLKELHFKSTKIDRRDSSNWTESACRFQDFLVNL